MSDYTCAPGLNIRAVPSGTEIIKDGVGQIVDETHFVVDYDEAIIYVTPRAYALLLKSVPKEPE